MWSTMRMEVICQLWHDVHRVHGGLPQAFTGKAANCEVRSNCAIRADGLQEETAANRWPANRKAVWDQWRKSLGPERGGHHLETCSIDKCSEEIFRGQKYCSYDLSGLIYSDKTMAAYQKRDQKPFRPSPNIFSQTTRCSMSLPCLHAPDSSHLC